MRISFLLPTYPMKPSGGPRVVYEYANHLVARGHTVYVIHPFRLALHQSGNPVIRWAKYLYRHIMSLHKPRISWQIIDPRVKIVYIPDPKPCYIPNADIIVATWWETAEIVAKYPLEKGRKYYLIQHYETWAGPKNHVDATWHLPLKKIVIAKWLYEQGLKLSVPKSEMCHIPNAINHNVFRLINPIASRQHRIAMLYSRLDWKGGKDGVTTLKKVKERFSQIEAILFGVESRPKELPEWITYIQNPSQSILVKDIYNRCCIYLGSSWTEGWYLPGAEAMACGCAVVSTDNGGIRDYLKDGKTGILVPPKDVSSLVQAVCDLLENDKKRLQLAKTGYEQIQNFQWSKSTEKLESFFKQSNGVSL